jgi:hypothetical protein
MQAVVFQLVLACASKLISFAFQPSCMDFVMDHRSRSNLLAMGRERRLAKCRYLSELFPDAQRIGCDGTFDCCAPLIRSWCAQRCETRARGRGRALGALALSFGGRLYLLFRSLVDHAKVLEFAQHTDVWQVQLVAESSSDLRIR